MDDHNAKLSVAERSVDRVVNRMVQWVSTMLVMRGLSSLWNNATEYVQSYYDKLNEIRIVTMSSEEESRRMGHSYRKLANDLKVSSTEIAEAAVEFWRQGLSEDKVGERLENTTKYAKISSLGFADAAEIVTAATNAMEISAGRAVDVFTY